MKISLFLSSLWLFLASLFAPAENTVLTGNVSDGKEPLIGATVRVLRGSELVRAGITDFNGDYRINLDAGTYDVEFSYTGYQAQRIAGVRVLEGKITTQDAVLTNSSILEEVVVLGYKAPLIEQDKTSSGQTLSSDQIKNLPTRDINAINATTVGASSVDGGDVKIKGAREKEEKADRPAEYAGAKRKSAPAAKSPAPSKPSPLAPGAGPIDADDINIKGSRTTPTDYYIDGIRVSGTIPPVVDLEQLKVVEGSLPPEMLEPAPTSGTVKFKDSKPALDAIHTDDEDAPATGTPAQPAPRAGLLTAGEWNDLHNWNRHWVDILADGETDEYQKMYGFFPRQRYTVMLTNDNGFPIADAVVQLKSTEGTMIWEARTDNTGKAELWAGLFSAKKETERLRVEAWVDGKKHPIANPKPASEGFNYLKINVECSAPKSVDIVWAVDATGSMGDEIEYLKTELLDVIGRAKSRNPGLEYRMGTVFYRDQGDEYVTKNSGLSTDIAKTVEFIQQQFAAGGGDYPEAVHSALEEAIFTQNWSEHAVARICFLVLDASPHQGELINASLQKSIREAARRGIRIVPIAASGIQKDTEFLMKFFGLATNGTYVFLTDHSGIGGKHIAPTTDEYKVEPLNNLLVRLITEYTTIQTCEGKSEIRFENDPQQQPGPMMQALYYPNPAVDQFTLELPFEVQSVTIYDSEGKAVRKIEKPTAGPNVVFINDLAAGFYTIRILNNGLMQSGKLMVVRS
jgi:hypothetical protein